MTHPLDDKRMGPSLPTRNTTDLDLIKTAAARGQATLNRFPYTWGRIDAVHSIGRYDIVEYVSSMASADGSFPLCFGVYVDGKECSMHAHTLESALLIGMDVARNGKTAAMNNRAAYFAAKVLDINV